MNTEQVQELIATAFLHRGPSATNKYILGILYGDLVCVSHKTREHVDPIFAIVSSDTIHRGFTGLEWESMAIKIAVYCKRNQLCLKDLTR